MAQRNSRLLSVISYQLSVFTGYLKSQGRESLRAQRSNLLFRQRLLRRLWLLAMTLILTPCLLLLSACPRPEGTSAKEDLTQYIDKARLWAATESQINTAVAKVREDQFVHDDLTITTLRPVVGISQEYVQQLESYQPQTPPLRNVHLEYIEAWRAHYLAIAAIIDSVEKKDYIQLSQANNDLLEAQRSVSDALADLARLMREAGLRSESAGDRPSVPPSPPLPSPGFEVTPKGS